MNLSEGWMVERSGKNARHRGQHFSFFLENSRGSLRVGSIRGISVCIIKIEPHWYVAEFFDSREQLKDYGPFATVEEAIVLFQLLKD